MLVRNEQETFPQSYWQSCHRKYDAMAEQDILIIANELRSLVPGAVLVTSNADVGMWRTLCSLRGMAMGSGNESIERAFPDACDLS